MGLPPGKHENEIKTLLCSMVATELKPLYDRMSSKDLLSQCVLQVTQNANESIQSVIWNRCPKNIFACKPLLDIAVAVAVGEFNFGSAMLRQFIQCLNLDVGHQTQRRGIKRDALRIQRAEAASSKKAKTWRATRAAAQLAEEERLKEVYGDLYGAGIEEDH